MAFEVKWVRSMRTTVTKANALLKQCYERSQYHQSTLFATTLHNRCVRRAAVCACETIDQCICECECVGECASVFSFVYIALCSIVFDDCAGLQLLTERIFFKSMHSTELQALSFMFLWRWNVECFEFKPIKFIEKYEKNTWKFKKKLKPIFFPLKPWTKGLYSNWTAYMLCMLNGDAVPTERCWIFALNVD